VGTWRDGDRGNSSIQRFRQVIQTFSTCLFAKRSYQVLSILETSFRTPGDAISIEREKSEKTEESGSLLVAIFYVFVRYLVKPLHCDYAVHVFVSTGYCIRVYVRKD